MRKTGSVNGPGALGTGEGRKAILLFLLLQHLLPFSLLIR